MNTYDVLRLKFDNKYFVKDNLHLGPSFHHVPQLEDYQEDYVDEFEIRRRDWSRITFKQIVDYKIGCDINDILDDGYDIIEPMYVSHV